MNLHAPFVGGVSKCFLCDLRRHIERSRRQVNDNPAKFIDAKKFIDDYIDNLLGDAFKESKSLDQDASEFMKYDNIYTYLPVQLALSFLVYLLCVLQWSI